MARSNGGIIGKSNKTSFGKNRVTTVTASGDYTTPSSVTKINTALVAGGGGGGYDLAAGGGAGGLLNDGSIISVCASRAYPIVIGAGGHASLLFPAVPKSLYRVSFSAKSVNL